MSNTTGRPPRLGELAWRLGLASAIAGLVIAAGLAVTGVVGAGEGTELFASLIPAIIAIGLGMAMPPFLMGMLGLAATQRPPRRLGREAIAVAIGAFVGALISPVLFYASSPEFGLLVGGIVAAFMIPTYCVVLSRRWKRARPAPAVT